MKREARNVLVLVAGIIIALSSLSCDVDKPVKLVVIEKQDLPVVYFRVMVTAGSAYDPADKPGLAYFTAHLLNKGTTRFSREDIEKKLDDIGATIDISVDKEVVVITGRTLKENLSSFYPIFKEILISPAFPVNQLELQKAAQLDRINQVREDDARLSLAVLENHLFAGHRYGHLECGTEAAVSRFTKEDAASFYRDYYLRGNTLAGIAGAVDDSLVACFEADLDLLPKGAVVRISSPAQRHSGRKVILIEKENRTQSHLRIGHLLDFNRAAADFFPMRLVWCYLGEHREMFGRLFRQVRKTRGLAYGAYAYTEYFRQAGWSKLQDNGIVRKDQYFHMWTYPKEINFEFCIKLMIEEMTGLATAQISDADFELVKSYVANNFPFLMETPDKQLGMKLDEFWYDTPGFVDNYQQQIASVDRETFQQAAGKHLRPSDLLIVAVVSDGAQATQELLSAGAELELPSGVLAGDLKAANDRIKALDLGLTAEDITIVKAADLFK